MWRSSFGERDFGACKTQWLEQQAGNRTTMARMSAQSKASFKTQEDFQIL